MKRARPTPASEPPTQLSMEQMFATPGPRDLVRGITIDGSNSRDLDDALWLEEREDGILARICISDASSAVSIHSGTDVRARARGHTVYRSTRSEPMLPAGLSEDSLSLLPDQLRPVVCLEVSLTRDFCVHDITIRRATLRSAMRLSYAEAAAIARGYAEGEQQALGPMLCGMWKLAKALLASRKRRGELAFYEFDSRLASNEEGQLRTLLPSEANCGYMIVQEWMILANRTIAEYLVRADVPALYRNHVARIATPPRDELRHNVEEAIAHPKHVDLKALRERINLLLSSARYEPVLRGHYGLDIPAYLHFTSPLRRYADLVNHRCLLAQLDSMPAPYTAAELAAIGQELYEIESRQLRRSSGRSIEPSPEAESAASMTRAPVHNTPAETSQDTMRTTAKLPLPHSIDVVAPRPRNAEPLESPVEFPVVSHERTGQPYDPAAAMQTPSKPPPARAEHTGQENQRLLLSAERILRCSQKRFAGLLQHAYTLESPPSGLAEAIHRRLNNRLIQVSSLVYILFRCGDSGEWRALREEALAWLVDKPNHAVSTLAQCKSIPGWSAAEYTVTVDDKVFSCVARIVTVAGAVETGVFVSWSEKKARASSALALCFMLCDRPVPEAALTAINSAAAPRVIPTAIGALASKDPIAAAYLMCQRAGWKTPDFQFRYGHEGAATVCRCRAVVSTEDRHIEAEAVAERKIQSKRAACAQLVEMLNGEAKRTQGKDV